MDDKCFIPKPKSRFVKIQCNACNSSSVIFTMAKSEINCKFCGNILAEPTGGKAKIFGTSLGIVDELSKIIIKTVQKDTKNQVTKLLLDSMIIHQIINNQSIQMFKKKFSNPSKTLIILDRVLIEMIHMEKHVYRVFLTREQIIEKLKEIAPVEIITLDHASEDMVKAREMYESKKYINDEKIPLSETDCILLLMHLKRVGDLITLDKTLMDAAQKEGLSLTFD